MEVLKNYLKTLAKLVLGRGVRKSYGQFGEDALIQALVKHTKKGVYVDVGAYHPTLYSNTYALYRKGWRGIAVDPNPSMQPLFRLLRPRDTFVCAAIAEPGAGDYYMFDDGAYNTFDAAAAEERKQLRWLKFLGKREIPLKPLAAIIAEHRILRIDFLNIDVEGKDLEVLQSHDWSIAPQVIAVEDDSFDPARPADSAVYNFLASKGYALAGLCGLTLVWKIKK